MAVHERLPWDNDPRDQRRFRLLLGGFLGVTLVITAWIAAFNLPEVPRAEREALPPQLAKVVLEKKTPPKPKPKPKVVKKPEPKPKPKVVRKPKPKPEPRVVQKPSKPRPAPQKQVTPPAEQKAIEKAREVAKKTGLLAQADELNDLRELVDDVKPLAQAPAQRAVKGAAKTQEALVTRAKTRSSGGIAGLNLKKAQASGERLAAHKQATVQAPVDPNAGEERGTQVASDGKTAAGRSSEEIRRVFDASKGTIMRMYTRALRKNPTLQGQFVPELTIEPDGSVSSCKVVSSELKAPALEKNLCNRLRMLNFGAKSGAPQQIVRYTFDFLPS